MFSVSYTDQEAQAALQLYDAAVKALGMQAAEAGLVLSKKLTDAKAASLKTSEVAKSTGTPSAE